MISQPGYNRTGHTCTCTRNGTLLCHAGGISTDAFKDTYVFDPDTNHFSKVESNTQMDIRMYHAVAYVEGEDLLYMYGGFRYHPSIHFNDLWMMDTNVQGKDHRYHAVEIHSSILLTCDIHRMH